MRGAFSQSKASTYRSNITLGWVPILVSSVSIAIGHRAHFRPKSISAGIRGALKYFLALLQRRSNGWQQELAAAIWRHFHELRLKASLRTCVSRRAQEEEEVYMRVMAELDAQDDTLDDGEVKIDDDEVWGA
ncbi:hypothetical protein B0H11DRAFT_1911774 [Mycena galericulata]|nr:hypothetical protein B0H11DRAFT_1911774 [Mycena galericulata]